MTPNSPSNGATRPTEPSESASTERRSENRTDDRCERSRRRRTASAATGPPRPPWLYRFVRDQSGQSAVIGVALLLALTVIGTTAVVTLGGSALTDTQGSADLQRTEHVMTLLDSRGAMTALGDADSQEIDLGTTGDGRYEVRPNEGSIRVVHQNFSGNSDEVIFEQTLGSVEYTTGDTTIAYQGGGIWRTQGNGTTMVSPPEFHYRDQTLTMPLVRVKGSGSASGRVSAEITPVTAGSDVNRIYPTEDTNPPGAGSPYDGTGEPYGNPVTNGTVVVVVESEHYKGWAKYFESRTDGKLTVDHSAQTATVELESLKAAPGAFDMPLEGNTLEVPSLATNHNVTAFSLSLDGDRSNNNEFKQLHWSMYDEGPNGQQFELHFASNGKCSSGDYDDDVEVSLYFRNNTTAPSHEWSTIVPQSDVNDPTSDVSIDCTGGKPKLNLDLLSSSMQLEYDEISSVPNSDSKWHFGEQINDQTVPSSATLVEHPGSHATETVSVGNTRSMKFLINHYFSVMGPDFELVIGDGPGGSKKRIDEGASSGVLLYDNVDGAQFIQYLHITENEITVELES